MGHDEHRAVFRVLLHVHKGLFVVVRANKLNVPDDRVNNLVHWQNVLDPLRLGVEISLLEAHDDLDYLFVRSMDIDVVAKERLSQPNVQSPFDDHLRDLFGDRPQERNDFSLDHVGFSLEGLFKGEKDILMAFA